MPLLTNLSLCYSPHHAATAVPCSYVREPPPHTSQEAARAARIQAEADQIKAQEAALKVAAAKAEAQLQRAELVEKAKEAEQQQQVQKAAGSFMDLLGLTEADLGLSK
jgi:hypothetical protein